MFLSYLILSDKYFNNQFSCSCNALYENLQKAYYVALQRNESIDFAAFRYANNTFLTPCEYKLLLSFLEFCSLYNVVPLINLSAFKLESLLALYWHGFYVGLHFKENDKLLLQNHICFILNKLTGIINNLKKSSFDHAMLQSISEIIIQECKASHFLKHGNVFYDSHALQESINNLGIAKKYFHNNLAMRTMQLQKQFFLIRQETRRLWKLDKSYSDSQQANMFLGWIQDSSIMRFNGAYPYFFSAHSLHDLQEAFCYGIDYATISPIFYDKGNKALGIEFLHQMQDDLKIRSIGLGGVSNQEKIALLRQCGLAGFAAISYFIN